MNCPGFKDRTRIGIVGAGVVTSGSHLPVLVNIADATVEWICDRSLAAAASVAKSYGIRGVFTEIRQCPDVDVVLVATPVGSRSAVVPEVLARGWHALCEKPFALTLADHEAYVAEARARGLRIAVGQVRRYAKPTASARALLQRGAFGPIERVAAAEGFHMRGTGRGTGWHMNDRKAGGGVLGEFGSHLIDQVLYILGVTSPADAAVRDCTQRVHLGLELAASLVADISTPAGLSIPCSIDVSLLEDLCNGVFIEFRDVVLRAGLGFEDKLTLLSKRGDVLSELVMADGADSPVQAFYLEWRDFLDHCRTGAPCAIDAATVRATTAFIDAGRQSGAPAPAMAAGSLAGQTS
jgi:predicted dehydrogenase